MRSLLWLVLLASSSFGLGRLLLLRAKFARPLEEYVFSSALGLAVLGYLAVVLGAVGLMRPPIVGAAFWLTLALSIPSWWGFLRTLRSRKVPRPDVLGAIGLGAITLAALVNLAVTLNPILEVDTYEYHITVPKAWLLAGRIFPIPYCLQSNYHFLADMLNVVALSLSRNDVVLCKLIQWYSGLLLAAATWCFGRHFFSKRVGWTAAVLLYLGKEISWISATGYIDLTVGLFVFLGIFALVRAARSGALGAHLLSGLFFGCAFAAKQPGAMFLAMAYFAYAAVLLFDRAGRRRLRHWPAEAALAGAMALAVASPWMIKNYAYTGDPFFPFLARSFDIPPEFAEPATGFSGYYGGLSRYVLWDSATVGQLVRAFRNFRTNVIYSVANQLVVWFLVSIAALILLRRRKPLALRLLIGTGALAAPWFAWVWSRFLFGFFPVYTLVLAETLALLTRRKRRVFALVSAALFVFYGTIFVRYNVSERYAKRLELTHSLIVSGKAREKWLLENDPSYAMVRRINGALGKEDRLLVCGPLHSAPLLEVPFVPNPHTLSKNLLEILRERFHDPDSMKRYLDDLGVTHILMPDGEAWKLDGKSGFVRRWLEKLFGEQSLSLYRLRSHPRDPALTD